MGKEKKLNFLRICTRPSIILRCIVDRYLSVLEMHVTNSLNIRVDDNYIHILKIFDCLLLFRTGTIYRIYITNVDTCVFFTNIIIYIALGRPSCTKDNCVSFSVSIRCILLPLEKGKMVSILLIIFIVYFACTHFQVCMYVFKKYL